MKPFDLERAQAGDPIMIALGYGSFEWRPAHFVGLSRDGSPVVQIESVVITIPDRLRMAPRKRTVFVNIWEGDLPRGSVWSSGGQSAIGARAANWFETEKLAREAASSGGEKSVYCLADAVPVEISE